MRDVEAASGGQALHSLVAADPDLRVFVEKLQKDAVARALDIQYSRGLEPRRRRVLVTGSQGFLGSALVLLLRALGTEVRGIDVVSGDTTDFVGSVAEIATVRAAMIGCDAVVHTASLHAPHAHHCDELMFERVNVLGTENVVAAAGECECERFVYVSTTSLMVTELVKRKQMMGKCVWLSVEGNSSDKPRNMYGRTKLAAEGICEKAFKEGRMQSCVVLRLSRFFPEDPFSGDMHESISLPNLKAIELLGRRVALHDALSAVLLALDKEDVEFGPFVIAAPWQFSRAVAEDMDASEVAELVSHIPYAKQQFAAQGWSLPRSIGQVYDVTESIHGLGWKPSWTFEALLNELRSGKGEGYHNAKLGCY